MEAKACQCIVQWVNFTFVEHFFTWTWNPVLVPIIADTVQHLQKLFHVEFSVSKYDEAFYKISVALVLISRKQKQISINKSGWTYFANISNWAHDMHAMLVNSSSWIENRQQIHFPEYLDF